MGCNACSNANKNGTNISYQMELEEECFEEDAFKVQTEEDKAQTQADIEKYEIPIETIPMIKEDFDKTSYILIRHGLSTFNFKNLEVKKEFGNGSDEWRAVQKDASLIDPELHPAGYLQCEAAHPVVADINFTIVFTSPMQRAIMTTIHMFKDHPNKKKIQFKVLPLVCEIMNATNTIAMDCHKLMAKYKNGSARNYGIEFDWSRMYDHGIPSLWQIYGIGNITMQQEIFSQLKITEGKNGGAQKTNVNEVLQETMKNHPSPWENWEALWQRGNVIKNFLKANLVSNPVKGDEKIAMVCHSHLIAAITSDGPDYSERRGFTGFYWTQNCQLLPFTKF